MKKNKAKYKSKNRYTDRDGVRAEFQKGGCSGGKGSGLWMRGRGRGGGERGHDKGSRRKKKKKVVTQAKEPMMKEEEEERKKLRVRREGGEKKGKE